MTQLLALAAAALFGFADFAGGLASRSASPWKVTAWTQLLGLPVLAIGVLVVHSTEVRQVDLALGVAAGLLGLAGIVLFYSALASGRMSIVAPVVGALAAAIPVAWDLATGGTITAVHWVGIGFSLGAVVFLTFQPSSDDTEPLPLAKSIGAAIAFALFFIAMSQTNETSGLWPLVAARAITIPVAFIISALLGVASLPEKSILPVVVFAGIADMAANVAILLALQRGPLGISAVLSSLYPAFTIVAAMIVLKERPSVPQRIGIGLAVVAVGLLAI